MFGIGVPEFFTVLILALIVLGPERLPLVMRTLGRWVRQLRQMTRDFRREFAEEFSILYEEMDVLRQEAENTRQELADIRSELSDTLQGAADDVNQAGQGIAEDLRGAVSAGQAGTDASPGTTGSAAGTSSTPAVPAPTADAPATPASPALPAPASASASSTPSEPLPAADAMALAIQDTFAPEVNGQAAVPPPVASAEPAPQPPPAAQPAAPQPVGQRLSAYAPDVNGPTEPAPPSQPAEPPSVAAPAPVHTAASAATTPDEPESPAAALGPPTPGLQNQMGGFMRLMVMQAIEADPGFADQAEEALRSQARADAESLGDLEDPAPLDIAQAWAARRRHLVPHDAVEVDQRAESSAVIEFGVCPYGLTPGKDHPVCSVSNVYDDEFFKQFDMKATYTTRMSDGADRCQLIILTHARMRQFGLKIEDDTRNRNEAEAEHEAVF